MKLMKTGKILTVLCLIAFLLCIAHPMSILAEQALPTQSPLPANTTVVIEIDPNQTPTPIEQLPSLSADMLFHNSNKAPDISVEGTLHIGVLSAYDANNPVAELLMGYLYPNIQIVYHLYTEDTLRLELMSNKTKLDMLIIDQTLLSTFSSGGLLENLQTLKTTWNDEMIDVQSLCMDSEAQYGFPRALYQSFWMWNDALAQVANIKRPEGNWTWVDFLTLAESNGFSLSGDGARDFYLMEGASLNSLSMNSFIYDMLEQYYNETIAQGGTFATQEYMELLKMFKRLVESGSILDMDLEPKPQYQDGTAVLIVRFSASAPAADYYAYEGQTVMMPPLLAANNEKYSGYMNFFSLLKNAPNRIAAEKFFEVVASSEALQCYTAFQPETIFSKSPPAYSIMNPYFYPEESFIYQKGEAATVYRVDNTANYNISEDLTFNGGDTHFNQMQYYRERAYLPNMELKEYYQVLFPLLSEYLQNRITEEDIIQRLDENLAMIRGE